MKKLVFAAAMAAMMIGMYSCGGSTSAKSDTDDGAAIKAKIEKCSNPDSLKIYVQQAREHARKLAAQGDSAVASAYIKDIVPAVQKKDAAVARMMALTESADYTTVLAVDSTKSAVENAADSVAAAASSAYNSAKEAVSEKAGEVKDASVNAYNSAKDATVKAADDAKAKAAEALQAGADKLRK